jgi:bacterioferritin
MSSPVSRNVPKADALVPRFSRRRASSLEKRAASPSAELLEHALHFVREGSLRASIISRGGLPMPADITRNKLIELLNGDLAREYQAIITYVNYSQVLKGAAYMSIAQELEKHASEELHHALVIAKQIDYLGGMPTVKSEPVKTSEDPEQMLRFDLDNENATVRNYRERVKQCEALGEYAVAEEIREILRQEQEHQIDLATALGEDVPDVSEMAGAGETSRK